MPTPVLFLIFNRPDLTARVFARIRESRPSKLYVAADGPRATKEGEPVQCEQTRAATENIDWPCEVHRLYRTENLGCKFAVSSAITWFFEHEPEGIILEDDCLPDLTFFRFCSEMLEQYRNHPRIGTIGGSNFQPANANQQAGDPSYYFSQYPHIWGWATWRRVWQHYDVSIAGWNGDQETLKRDFPNAMVRLQIVSWLDAIKSGGLDTWDYQLFHLLITRRLLAVNPAVNLVGNIGFGPEATHTAGAGVNLPQTEAIGFPLRHPEVVEAHPQADRHTETVVHGIPRTRLTGIIRKILSRGSKLRKIIIK